MGIPRFFRSLTKRYKSQILQTIQPRQRVPIPIDNFWLDMNGLIHEAAQWTYGYGTYSKVGPHVDLKLSEKEILKTLFHRVSFNIDRIMNVVNPRKRLIIALDGICPRAKQQQQRKRRFRSACESGDAPFDGNSITPGTIFMNKLSEHLNFLIRFRLQTDKWRNISVIFSDSTEPGEGEHKIASMIRNRIPLNEKNCIYGLDADLVLISLVSPAVQNIYLLREDVWSEHLQFHFVNIPALKQELGRELSIPGVSIDDSMRDFVVMMNFIGNDFLPHQPLLGDMDWSLPAMYQAYRNTSLPLYSYENKRINYRNLGKFLTNLMKSYNQKARDEMLIEYKYPHKTLAKATIIEIDRKEKTAKYTVFTDLYMKMIDQMTTDTEKVKYIYFLDWVCWYYFFGVQDWESHYDSYHAPSLQWCIDYLSTRKNTFIYENNTTSIPSLQSLLIYVLPEKSMSVIPQHLYIQGFENITNIQNCHIHREGTNVEWMGHLDIYMPDDKIIANLEKSSKFIKPQQAYCYVKGTQPGKTFRNDWGFVNYNQVIPIPYLY